MDFFDAVKKRRSVREYQNKGIARELLEQIANSGRLAPTARSEEPWEFIIVEDRSLLEKISQVAPNGAFIKNAAAAVIVVCRNTKYYLEDGCAATENMLLAAAALGIGACWIAGDKKEYAPAVCTLLAAPSEYQLVSIIALGYPKMPVPLKERRPLENVIHFDSFTMHISGK